MSDEKLERFFNWSLFLLVIIFIIILIFTWNNGLGYNEIDPEGHDCQHKCMDRGFGTWDFEYEDGVCICKNSTLIGWDCISDNDDSFNRSKDWYDNISKKWLNTTWCFK